MASEEPKKYLVRNDTEQFISVRHDKGIPVNHVHIKSAATAKRYKEDYDDGVTLEEYETDTNRQDALMSEGLEEGESTSDEDSSGGNIPDPSTLTGDGYKDLIDSVKDGEWDDHLEELLHAEENGRDRAMLQEAIHDRLG